MNETKVIQVIYCNKEVRGSGKFPDPVRGIGQIIDFDGNVLMENDPEKVFTKKDMINFAGFIYINIPSLNESNLDTVPELFDAWERKGSNAR